MPEHTKSGLGVRNLTSARWNPPENVAPKEVEDVLALVPGVKECAVVGVPHSLWGEEVFAWVVPEEGAGASERLLENLRRHAASQLAEFKVPAYFELATRLPYTPSGKLAKGVLRQNAEAALARDSSLRRPSLAHEGEGSASTSAAVQPLLMLTPDERLAHLQFLVSGIVLSELDLQVRGDIADCVWVLCRFPFTPSGP